MHREGDGVLNLFIPPDAAGYDPTLGPVLSPPSPLYSH